MTIKMNYFPALIIFAILQITFPKWAFATKQIYSLADQKLVKIIEAEQHFLSNEKQLPNSPSELTRKAQDLVASYEAYISENPRDTYALILYGKFLQKVGQSEHALGFFLQADSINPKLAVVKQQIANYLVESERPVEALPFFVAAVEINPEVPEYHFHLGNYLHIFKDEIISSQLLKKDVLEKFSHQCFKKAAEGKSDSFDYRLRHAQSVFDCEKLSPEVALSTWQSIERDFGNLTKAEKDYLKLCQARILIDLSKKDQAVNLINSVTTKSLQTVKKTLLESSRQSNQLIETKKKEGRKKTGTKLNLQHDPHLFRLQKVTTRLREESLIRELQIDAVKAHHDENGHIKLTLNQLGQN